MAIVMVIPRFKRRRGERGTPIVEINEAPMRLAVILRFLRILEETEIYVF